MSKVVNWIDFVRFITDQDMWSRWEWESTLTDTETYFIEAYNAAISKKTMTSFDFDKTELRVMSKDASSVNWDHDGETLWYFFNIWRQGRRV